MSVESQLQPLTGEIFPFVLANVEDGACLDVVACGFWGSHHQKVFLNVKVVNPNASSYRGSSLSSLYHRMERGRSRGNTNRVFVSEDGTFYSFDIFN